MKNTNNSETNKKESNNFKDKPKTLWKDIFDLVLGIIGFILLSPILVIISVLVVFTSKGPAFFKQDRVGKNGRVFGIYKFRTMITNAEDVGLKLTIGDDPRITSVGKVLRKYKLDELTQIINIVIGDMSFVGPRPEVPKYVAMYNPEQRKVLIVKPGVTDLASIKFRNENEILGKSKDPEKTYIEKIMPEKLRINLEYVENISLLNDIRLILKTIKEVFFRS
ncbi:MAG: sugar transferase [Clostridiaceae bacterium]